MKVSGGIFAPEAARISGAGDRVKRTVDAGLFQIEVGVGAQPARKRARHEVRKRWVDRVVEPNPHMASTL